MVVLTSQHLLLSEESQTGVCSAVRTLIRLEVHRQVRVSLWWRMCHSCRAKRRRLITPEPLAMAVDVRTPHMQQQTLTAAKQSTRMVATLEEGSPRTPRKQRHHKGEEGHQEWCREGFNVKEVLGPDKRPRSITAVCRICLKDHHITKRYKVLSYNPRKKYPTSASWTGPSNHLKDKHDIFSIEALRDKLSKPPGN